MLRILLIIFIILAILGGGYYVYTSRFQQKNTTQSATKEVPGTNDIQLASSSASVSDRLNAIENAITILNQKFTDHSNSSDTRITNLENTVNGLQNQLNQQKSSSSATTTSTVSTNKAPLYIPLGWNGSGTNQGYTTINTQKIIINGSEYQGYTSMQLEASIRIYQGNGQAFARIYDSDDGTAINGSEVSTTAQDYTWVTSGNFTIPAAQKTYYLQIKTLTGYSADVLDARIKVNF